VPHPSFRRVGCFLNCVPHVSQQPPLVRCDAKKQFCCHSERSVDICSPRKSRRATSGRRSGGESHGHQELSPRNKVEESLCAYAVIPNGAPKTRRAFWGGNPAAFLRMGVRSVLWTPVARSGCPIPEDLLFALAFVGAPPFVFKGGMLLELRACPYRREFSAVQAASESM
jgi:hypothetical protein